MARIVIERKKNNKFSVMVNGKRLKRNLRLSGVRDKYIYGKMIIKVDSEEDYEHAANESEIYRKLSPEDKKYFPKLIRSNKKIGFIIQELMDIDVSNKPIHRSKKNKNIVKDLIKKYSLTDVHAGSYNYNWGVNPITGDPIIFDLGYK